MKFSHYGMTINSHEIVNSINGHGLPVFHTSEIHIKPYLCRKSVCNLADIIAVFRRSGRYYVVGIEIKEWGAHVYPGMASLYLDTYRQSCEYFYLAANRFSKSTFELQDVGLFDLNEMRIVKHPAYLFPDTHMRANLMKRIKKHFQVLPDAVEDPYQRTFSEF